MTTQVGHVCAEKLGLTDSYIAKRYHCLSLVEVKGGGGDCSQKCLDVFVGGLWSKNIPILKGSSAMSV